MLYKKFNVQKHRFIFTATQKCSGFAIGHTHTPVCVCVSSKVGLLVGGNMILEGVAALWIIAHSLIYECLSCF